MWEGLKCMQIELCRNACESEEAYTRWRPVLPAFGGVSVGRSEPALYGVRGVESVRVRNQALGLCHRGVGPEDYLPTPIFPAICQPALTIGCSAAGVVVAGGPSVSVPVPRWSSSACFAEYLVVVESLFLDRLVLGCG